MSHSIRSLDPHSVRAPLNGLIVHHGYVVAEWGDTTRVDMTHSVTKTFLTTVVGLAWQKGLIRDIGDKARDYMPYGVDLFDAPHNQSITWEHLLRQSSDWQGTLWGKPDWGDRPVGKPAEWANRPLYEPGTHFKYNDVRVNVMALAALHVWRRPLPQVLRDETHGTDRGVEHVALVRLRELVGRHRRHRKCSPSRAAATGAAACSSTPGTWQGSVTCFCAMANGRIARLFLRNGSRWRGRRGPPTPSMALRTGI